LGRKMSKSLGNGVDPIEVIDQYGADTLRFMLITGNTAGNDLRFHPERLEATRNFANKIWNASRFVLMNIQDYEPGSRGELTLADEWILARFAATAETVTEALERFDLGEAGRALYEFIWNEFCDWYIELCKPRLYDRENQAARHTAQTVLIEVLDGTLTLLHPFMPFITEEIWQNLKEHLAEGGETLMLRAWPQRSAEDAAISGKGTVEKKMALIMDVIKAVRNIRAEMNIPPGKKAELMLVAPTKENQVLLELGSPYIRHLAGCSQLEILAELKEKPQQAASAVLEGVEVYVPLRGLLDLEKEIARIAKEIVQTEQEEERLRGKLNNPGFVNKAPAEVVAKEREKLDAVVSRKAALQVRLQGLQ